MKKPADILPPRDGETSEERRLRETLNRRAGQLLTTLDAAIALRTAPADAAKARHQARSSLMDFARKAQHAHSLSVAARVRTDT